MENELEELRKAIRLLTGRLETLEAENATLRREIERKDRIIEGLQKRLFGSSSEKIDPAQADFEFGEDVLGKPEPLPGGGATSAPEEEGAKGVARTRRKKAELFPQNLAVVIADVLVPDEVAASPDEYTEIGEEHHDELDITRSRMFWRRTVRKKFVRKTDRTQPPVIAPAPPSSIPGTLCSPDLAALILTDKGEDHLPHYRQSLRFRRRFGVELRRQTLNTWHHATCRHLSPIGAAIKSEVLAATELQIDESPVDYLDPGHGSARTGYLWVYHSPQTGATWFDWRAGRGHEHLLGALGFDPETRTLGYRGTIQCDGYGAYKALVARYGGVQLAGCLAHIRRRFHEAREHSPEESLRVLGLIQRLYRVEQQHRHTAAHPACRKLIRCARSRPIAQSLQRLIVEIRSRHLPKSPLGEASAYALGEWEGFKRYLSNGGLEIDNNQVENRIRPAKLGVKNYLFNGSLEAGANNALVYTLLANCRTNGLDPEDYLAEVIRRLPHDATAEQAAALTPARIAAERAAITASESPTA